MTQPNEGPAGRPILSASSTYVSNVAVEDGKITYQIDTLGQALHFTANSQETALYLAGYSAGETNEAQRAAEHYEAILREMRPANERVLLDRIVSLEQELKEAYGKIDSQADQLVIAGAENIAAQHKAGKAETDKAAALYRAQLLYRSNQGIAAECRKYLDEANKYRDLHEIQDARVAAALIELEYIYNEVDAKSVPIEVAQTVEHIKALLTQPLIASITGLDPLPRGADVWDKPASP